MTDDGSAPRAARLQQHPGTEAWTHADSLLQNTWVKRDAHEFLKLLSVEEVDNPTLGQRYDNYKLSLTSLDGSTLPNGNEQLVFHGCAADAIPSILANGFQKKFWKSAAGDWQRFGPGFYFALQASKSHEYPLGPMRALPAGEHTRAMILCKVAKGEVLQTRENMDGLQGSAPLGYHSVHGLATVDGALNFDELVIYEEAAVLPYAVVTYRFLKHQPTKSGRVPAGKSPAPRGAAATRAAAKSGGRSLVTTWTDSFGCKIRDGDLVEMRDVGDEEWQRGIAATALDGKSMAVRKNRGSGGGREAKAAEPFKFDEVRAVVEKRASAARKHPVWIDDADPRATNSCMICNRKFGTRRRKHHCRYCGWLVCSSCAPEGQKRELGRWLKDSGSHGLVTGEATVKRICKMCNEHGCMYFVNGTWVDAS